MSRRIKASRRDPISDPRYSDILVTEFINCLMKKGKRSVAERCLYSAIETMGKKEGEDGLEMFKKAVNNVRPVLEVKSRRVGGATYQVPVEVRPRRKTALAIRWIITYAKARSGATMAGKLAAELQAAAANEGASIKKREDTHKMAEANKAFAHFRW
jgi:small subunit ribosomal protein S7